MNRTRSISNIQNIEPGSSGSHYLESEYNLVKKIISATKALQKLKTNPENGIVPTSQTCHNLNSTALDAQCKPQPAFRSVEEYCSENLSLKKKLLIMQNHETIMKAKMDYYEKELAKKDQEIMDILDVKKVSDSFQSNILHDLFNCSNIKFNQSLILRTKSRERPVSQSQICQR